MKKHFFTGLVVLLPILITIFIVNLIQNVLTGPFEKIVSLVLHQIGLLKDGFGIFSQKQMISGISKVLILVGLAGFILLVGIFTPRTFAQNLFERFEQFLEKIPFVNTLYRICKEFIHAFMNPQVSNYNLPAFVPYPSEDAKSLGLVMNEFTSDILGQENQEFAVVIIPCTPNPTTGVLCIMDKNDIDYHDVPASEALTFIMTLGNKTNEKTGK